MPEGATKSACSAISEKTGRAVEFSYASSARLKLLYFIDLNTIASLRHCVLSHILTPIIHSWFYQSVRPVIFIK